MPFFETAEDATYCAILQSGTTPKEVAHALWPHLKMDTAYARLMGALKHERPEKLTADEHLHIAKITGRYDFLYYCSQACHHSRPEAVSPEDEKTQLQQQFVDSVKVQQGILKRMESLA